MLEFQEYIKSGLAITKISGFESIECAVDVANIRLEFYDNGKHNYSSNELEYGQKWYEVEESKIDYSCTIADYIEQNEPGRKARNVIERYFGTENALWLLDYLSR